MNPSQKEKLIEKVMNQIMDLDVAWYLKTEVQEMLKHLHFYKIKNVYQNMDALIEYLELLDSQSTKQIHMMEYDKDRENELIDHDINYFISKKGLKKVGEHKIHQKIWDNDFNLSYIMQGIKGLLLLTADEFCNATPTRMSINRLLWQKELKKAE